MMTMTTINTIASELTYGMDFDTVLAIVNTYTDDVDVTVPDDVNFGSILVGNIYGNSLTLEFDDDDLLEVIDVDNGDWD